jgi:predicted alpha/beta hydrolase family esterase
MPQRGAPPASSSEEDDPHLPFAERWVAPFVREPLLWPVMIVIVAHAVAFLAPVLLLALRERRLAALGALTGVIVLSGAAVRAELARLHRPGVVCGLLAATWGLAVVAALVAHRTGIF